MLCVVPLTRSMCKLDTGEKRSLLREAERGTEALREASQLMRRVSGLLGLGALLTASAGARAYASSTRCDTGSVVASTRCHFPAQRARIFDSNRRALSLALPFCLSHCLLDSGRTLITRIERRDTTDRILIGFAAAVFVLIVAYIWKTRVLG